MDDLSIRDIASFTGDFEEDHTSRQFRLVRDIYHLTTLERPIEELTGRALGRLGEFKIAIRSKLA